MRNRNERIQSFKDYSGQALNTTEIGSQTGVLRSLADWLNDS